jgi:hypothetical protein
MQAERLFKQGCECYENYDYDGAIKAFKQLLIFEPNYDHGGGKIQGLIHELQEAKIEHERGFPKTSALGKPL